MNTGFLLAAGIVAAALTIFLWYQLGGFIAYIPLFVLGLLVGLMRFRAVNS